MSLFAGCSFRRPAQETPTPRVAAESLVVDKNKGFFGAFTVEAVTIEKEVRNSSGAVIRPARTELRRIWRPKTFLCGWAPEAEAGAFQDRFMHNVEAVTHCNLEFDAPTERYLIARIVNPSFPDDRSRWEIGLKIPIESHFYLEPKKDSSGRDTPETIENDKRSTFDMRPFMRLKLAGMEMVQFGFEESGLTKPDVIEDVDWDVDGGFLGFSATANSWIAECGWGECFGGNAQAKFRVNLRSFASNPAFRKTPFHDQNYRYMNVLHVVGKQVEGVYRTLYAAHWDLAKNPKVYLFGVPDEYRPLIQDVVADWNAALRRAGALAAGQPGFSVAAEPAKRGFDLRYPTIAWVDDRRISRNVDHTIGVGMAQADVRTGEILWGNITIYGAEIEDYLKSYLPTDGAPTAAHAAGARSLGAALFNPEGLASVALPPGVSGATGLASFAALPGAFSAMPGIADEDLLRKEESDARAELERGARENDLPEDSSPAVAVQRAERAQAARRLAEQRILMKEHKLSPSVARAIALEMAQLPRQLQAGAAQELAARPLHQRLLTPLTAAIESSAPSGPSQERNRQVTPAPPSEETMRRRAIAHAQKLLHSNVFDLDRTFGDVGPGWSAAIQALAKSPGAGDFGAIVRTVIKELVSHEYGHFLGLGHQFKENILPDEGTVPAKYLTGEGWTDPSTGQARPGLAELATEAAGWLNSTSVMGYRDPRTEIANRLELVKPGPQDILVLQYVYAQKYSVYKPGDNDFTPVPAPLDGAIPAEPPDMPGYKTAYFPQCNDFEASASMDPYCNRFDRGSTATDIVKNYVSSLTENLAQTLVAFSDGRNQNAAGLTLRLWVRSFDAMGRMRLFYDYMRRDPGFRSLLDEIRGDENMLYGFSRACTTEGDGVPGRLAAIMKENPKFKELCAASAYVMGQYKRLVSLNAVDFTTYDKSNGYVPGGFHAGDASGDFSHVYGSWSELTALPLKYAAMLAMQASLPWMTYEGGLYPVPGYDDPDSLARYSWLYPREFTEAVSSGVTSNLKFVGVDQTDRTQMGQAVLAMSYFNRLGNMPSDAGLFPPQFVDRVRGQTRFDLSLVAVVLTGEQKDGPTKELRVDRFSGVVLDFQGQKSFKVTEAYLLPDGQAIVRAPDLFLYPITKFRLFDDRSGYVLAYKLDYFRDPYDPFFEISVKSKLKDKHDSMLNACVSGPDGQMNGLSQFFNKTEKEFEGFYMPTGLYDDPDEKGKEYLRSVRDGFARYYASGKFKKNPPRRETCDEAIRGLGLIMSSAAVINGYWLPGIIEDNLQN